MFPPKVRRSTMAAQRRESVKVLVQPTGAEGFLGGDGDAGLFLAFGEDLEEELGAAAVEFHVAELVDAEQVDAAVAVDGLSELPVVGGLDELVDELGGEGVDDGGVDIRVGVEVEGAQRFLAGEPRGLGARSGAGRGRRTRP
jgi:hypothetical protein